LLDVGAVPLPKVFCTILFCLTPALFFHPTCFIPQTFCTGMDEVLVLSQLWVRQEVPAFLERQKKLLTVSENPETD
jgi:hypothetical protein